MGKSHLQPCPKIALLKWQNWPPASPSSTAIAVQLCGYLPLGMLMRAIKELNIQFYFMWINLNSSHVAAKLNILCLLQSRVFFFFIKVAYYQKLLKLGERKPVIQTWMSMESMLPISQKSLKSIFFKLFWSRLMLSVKIEYPKHKHIYLRAIWIFKSIN